MRILDTSREDWRSYTFKYVSTKHHMNLSKFHLHIYFTIHMSQEAAGCWVLGACVLSHYVKLIGLIKTSQ